MNKDIKMILDALNLLHTACQNIDGLGGCDKCPLNGRSSKQRNCLEETDVLTLAENVTASQFEEFLGFSDDVEDYMNMTEQDWEASYADQARKMDIEERMIDEEWGI